MFALLAQILLADLYSEVDLTPPEPLSLGGYTERGDAVFEAGEERLLGRAIAFDTDSGRVVLAVLEMLTVPASLRDAVQERVGDESRVVLVATHTHHAPDSQMLNSRMSFRIPGIAPYNSRWLDWYADRISELCNEAPFVEGPFLAAQVEHDWARTRRAGSEDARHDWFITAGCQHLIATYSAHPTILPASDMRLSGDFPGAWMRQHGGLALPSALGDQSPRISDGEPVENIKLLVEKMSASMGESRESQQILLNKGWKFKQVEVALGEPVPHPEFAHRFGAPEALAQVVIERFAEESASVSVLANGDFCMVFTPAEVSLSVVRSVQKLAEDSGFPHCIVISLSNGWIGYLLDSSEYERGGYEASLMFHGSGTAERLLEGVRKALADLASGS